MHKERPTAAAQPKGKASVSCGAGFTGSLGEWFCSIYNFRKPVNLPHSTLRLILQSSRTPGLRLPE